MLFFVQWKGACCCQSNSTPIYLDLHITSRGRARRVWLDWPTPSSSSVLVCPGGHNEGSRPSVHSAWWGKGRRRLSCVYECVSLAKIDVVRLCGWQGRSTPCRLVSPRWPDTDAQPCIVRYCHVLWPWPLRLRTAVPWNLPLETVSTTTLETTKIMIRP